MSKKRSVPNKVYLSENQLPKAWYNIHADMPNKLAPPLNPQTKKPAVAEDLLPIFPPALIEQEMSMERYIEIPEEVMDIYKTYRASPLIRAYRLEDALNTPARIYFKYEGATPSGSHKLNTAIPQAYYNKAAGIRRITTETGAGQWGAALSIACKSFGLDCTVYMVKVSAQQKPYRKLFMQTYGAQVFSSPSENTAAGRHVRKTDPDNPGTLGIAITEAVEDAVAHSDTNYSLGSVLNHVMLHQTIIGQEAITQFGLIDDYPDVVIGCCGGGSNFSGIAFPFLKARLEGKRDTEFIAVEPSACPTLTKGKFAYDYGDTGMMTPILPMYTLGHNFVPDGIHAGGLRYHGGSALLSQLCHDGFIGARAVHQTDVFKAATFFAHTEGILPAPESAHAILAAIEEAERCKHTGQEKTILFNLSGHGFFDMAAYEAYQSGLIKDVPFSDEKLARGLADLPEI